MKLNFQKKQSHKEQITLCSLQLFQGMYEVSQVVSPQGTALPPNGIHKIARISLNHRQKCPQVYLHSSAQIKISC